MSEIDSQHQEELRGYEELALTKKKTRAFYTPGYQAGEEEVVQAGPLAAIEVEAEVERVKEDLKEDGAPMPEHLAWLEEVLDEVARVMRDRGAKYGPGNIAEWGELGVLVRLSDKLARLRHSSGKDFADESVEDGWRDVIGYGLIGLAWSRGKWPGSERPSM